MKNIKAVLLDSGRVLNMSATGNWNYSPKFFDIVGEDNFYKIPKAKRKNAYRKAWEYVNSVNLVSSIEDEYDLFKEFFKILSKELAELNIDKDKIELLTHDRVLNFDKAKFFDDVFCCIPKLKEKYRLCIVSDAWPSLREVYKKAGLYTYFDDMIISTEIGVNKPNQKMYTSALKSLNLNADEVIFIDDNIVNCDGASKIGIKSILLDRVFINRLYYRFKLRGKYKIIKDLNDLLKLI